MAIYTFACAECQHSFDVSTSILKFDEMMADLDGQPCESCDGAYQLEVGTPIIIVEQEPQTLGQQARRNTKKMGHYEYQERCAHDRKMKSGVFEKPQSALPAHVERVVKANPDKALHNPIVKKWVETGN